MKAKTECRTDGRYFCPQFTGKPRCQEKHILPQHTYSTPVSFSRKKSNLSSAPKEKKQRNVALAASPQQSEVCTWTSSSKFLSSRRCTWQCRPSVICKDSSTALSARTALLACTRACEAWGQGQCEARLWLGWIRELTPYGAESFSKDSIWGSASALSAPVNFKLELRVLSSTQDQTKTHKCCEN